MKRAITQIFTLLLLITLAVPAFAENTEGSKKFMDGYQQYKEELVELLKRKDEYHETMDDFELTEDAVVIFVHDGVSLFANYDCGYDEMLEKGRQGIAELSYWRYAVMTNEKLQFVCYAPSTLGVYVLQNSKPEFTYLTDIKDMTKTIKICGVECEVKRIACYDKDSSHFGTLVYLDTDKGSFVRYYATSMAPAIEMTEAEYQVIAEQYWNYLISLPDGIGGGTSFAEFIKNPIIVDPPVEDDNENGAENLTTGTEIEGSENQNTENKSDKKSNMSILWWILPTAAAILFVGAAVAFVTYRKKKT